MYKDIIWACLETRKISLSHVIAYQANSTSDQLIRRNWRIWRMTHASRNLSDSDKLAWVQLIPDNIEAMFMFWITWLLILSKMTLRRGSSDICCPTLLYSMSGSFLGSAPVNRCALLAFICILRDVKLVMCYSTNTNANSCLSEAHDTLSGKWQALDSAANRQCHANSLRV